jgi:hypothetical protein
VLDKLAGLLSGSGQESEEALRQYWMPDDISVRSSFLHRSIG